MKKIVLLIFMIFLSGCQTIPNSEDSQLTPEELQNKSYAKITTCYVPQKKKVNSTSNPFKKIFSSGPLKKFFNARGCGYTLSSKIISYNDKSNNFKKYGYYKEVLVKPSPKASIKVRCTYDSLYSHHYIDAELEKGKIYEIRCAVAETKTYSKFFPDVPSKSSVTIREVGKL